MNFLRGVFAGVGSIFTAGFSDVFSNVGFLSLIMNRLSDGAPEEESAPPMALASLPRFEKAPPKDALCGEVCVEGGGE